MVIVNFLQILFKKPIFFLKHLQNKHLLQKVVGIINIFVVIYFQGCNWCVY